MDFTYNEKTVMSSGGFIPSTNDTPLDIRGRVNLYSEIKDIPNPYVGMEIRVLQDETNEGKMTKYKVTKLLSNEFGVPNSYIDTDTLEKISESLSDEDLVFDGICEDELEVITPQLKTDYNLTTTDKTIVGAINELKEALANITIGDNGEAVNLPFNSIDKGLASSNIDFSEIKNGNYCYIIRGTIGYDIPDGNLPLNNDMVHITKSNTAMTIITLSGGIYTYNGGTNGTDYISCTKDNFMTYSVASETYQLKNDSKLITTDKTVVGAINELKNALDSGVNGVSTILTVSPTYEELDTLPEGSKVYILNGLGYNGDPVHINKSSNTITLISIDGAINKYQKVGSSWSNYSTENWATQKYVDTAIANVQLGGGSGSVDLSEYQKITDSSLATTNKNIVGAINEVKSSVDGITVPTKTSDLTNDSGFITSIPSEYITETELETKGYLTEHQSLTDYAKKTDIPDVSDFLTEVPAGYVTDTKLSTELDKKVNKEAGKGLSTNDLTNELVIKINSSATEAFVTNAIANAQLGGGEEVDLSGYATIDALKLKADLTHTHDQYLTKVPDEYITETELTDKNYADKTYVTQAVSNVKVDLTGYAKTSDIPTKTSDLNNDSGFIGYPDVIVIDKGSMDAEVDLDNDIPLGRNTILLTGRVVYNTYEHELVFVYRDRESSNSFTTYTLRGDKVVVSKSNGKWSITSSTSFIYRDNANSLYQKITDNTLTTTAKTVPTAINELKSGLDGIKVPINISELNNDSGYLTSHQDISNLQTKTDKNLTTTSKEVVGAINELKTGVSSISVPTKVSQLTNDSGYLSTKDITSTINSTSTDTQIPTAKSVNVAIKGKLITQDDIDTYGKEIIKFPVGKWTIGSVAISNLTDLPNSYVRYIEIIGISEATNPWTNNNTLRSYKAISYKGDTFLRSLNSGSEAGVIAFDTGWQRVLLNGDIIDNLTSTDTNKLLSANQGKILNDTKLNKTDANKLNCVVIDNVSLKEYILTNFTETEEKTYYLIAKTTCTDLPKASNFYITVETPGLYTYKVTAKELNDSNGIYVCTYRTISSSWTKWEKVCTTTVADVGITYINTFENETYVKPTGTNSCSYHVINGHCIVTLQTFCLSTSQNFVQIVSGLPKPKTFLYSNAIDRNMKSNSGAKGVFQITTSGVINVACNYGDTSVTDDRNLYGTFSYPVAES